MKFDLDKYNEYATRGFCEGIGAPYANVCVEAAVCLALGEGLRDRPSCVDPIVRRATVSLNDMAWSDNKARSSGMRYLGLAGLGTKRLNPEEAVEFQFQFFITYFNSLMTNLVSEVMLQGAMDYPDLTKKIKTHAQFLPSFSTKFRGSSAEKELYLELGFLSVFLGGLHDIYLAYTNQTQRHDKYSRACLVVLALKGLVSDFSNEMQKELRLEISTHNKMQTLFVITFRFLQELFWWAKQSQILPILQPDIFRMRAANLAIQTLEEMGHTNEFQELWSVKTKESNSQGHSAS